MNGLDFIRQLIDASKAYLRGKYSLVDVNIPEEVFLSRLNWLKEEEIISDAEFFQLKNDYDTQKIIS
ncbi:MAG TPA: hypothetical protein DDZ96_06925 [Porphyromonadaceae bacterium]|jgi:hypothetical protein|uniref:hypothetical protein n=1 Tax=Limibacterium fermenti TaxID=3229863 RepID=UPI000E9E3A76|nr:hypothetical protein [Porphyromonadaceae bacterium]HBK32327.1 hypothetical protein [Porphyromonadaceae bacterium]HBL33536.1 hypothetical protein [Porphyromonadaceae bacterium]HBX19014.1 hypothetical protein [Porphyromonadaceae bacterium]HBX46445.1 hypothetical protein [Porphyromonadaceae bacterium]